MITNTCLTAGSLVAEPLEGDVGDPRSALEPPSAPVELGGAPAPAGAGALAAVVEASVAAGVGAGSDSGGSAEADEGAAGVEAAAVDGGSTSFRRRPAAASVLLTGDPATPPRSTPKPRNTSTSRTEIRGAGSRQADLDGELGETTGGTCVI
jgi:hypothetical protein